MAVYCAVGAAALGGAVLISLPVRSVLRLGDDAQSWTAPHGAVHLLVQVATLAITTILLGVYLRRRLRLRIRDIGLTAKVPWRKVLRGLLVGAGLGGCGTALAWAAGAAEPTAAAAAPRGVAGAVLLGLVYLVASLAKGVGAELLARGWLLHALARQLGVPLAILGQAVLFAAWRPGGGPASALHPVLLFAFGVFAALYVLWDRTLWGACALHGAFDAVVFPLAAGGLGLRDAQGRPDAAAVAAIPVILMGILVLTALLRRRGLPGGAERARGGPGRP
ncbi:hypothetical protein GCM10022205_50190 [Spinactinospora alkalitolerans]